MKGQVRAIEGFVARDIPWPTIEAATGIDEATFRRLRQRVDAKDNGTESTVLRLRQQPRPASLRAATTLRECTRSKCGFLGVPRTVIEVIS